MRDKKLSNKLARRRFGQRIHKQLLRLAGLNRKGIGRLFMQRSIGFESELSAVLIRKDGQKYDYGVIGRKVITTEFAEYLAVIFVTDNTNIGDFKYHKSGTGTNAENKTDTQLQTSVEGTARDVGDQNSAARVYTSIATIAYTGTHAIIEHGIFNEAYADAEDNGILLDRTKFAASMGVVTGDSIQFTYNLTINDDT